MRRLLLIALVGSVSGCVLFFDDHGEQPCVLTDDVATEPAQTLRNPEQLTCDPFGGGGTCNPECGPCPAASEAGAFAPLPSWGVCGSACDGLDEAMCETREDCRVARDARCAISGACPDFMGCFPTDQFVDPATDCIRVTDGETCSRSSACTAFHRNDPCPAAGAIDGLCPRQFALCMPEGSSPGRCFDPALCDSNGPACPTGTTAGVINGCFSGACIPNDLCELIQASN